MSIRGKFDHVAIVVDDLGTSVKFYKEFLGFREVLRATDEPAGLKLVFLSKGSKMVELMKWSEGRHKDLNHVCFEVTDLRDELEKAKKRGYKVTLPYLKTPMGWEIAFFRGPDNVPVELLTREEKTWAPLGYPSSWRSPPRA